ncbi:hypothetical protein [Methylobacterium sp. W2]|nr:hypothetical protein [Methylobacterium sp. W2]
MARRFRIVMGLPLLPVLRVAEVASEWTAVNAGIAFDRLTDWIRNSNDDR